MKKNIRYKTCLLVIWAIIVLVVLLYNLFFDEIGSEKNSENDKQISKVFEDDYVEINIKSYTANMDFVEAEFLVKSKSKKNLIIYGDEWNLEDNVTFEADGSISIHGKYDIFLKDKAGGFVKCLLTEQIVTKEGEDVKVCIKEYLLAEHVNELTYVISNGETEEVYDLISDNEGKLIIQSSYGDWVITPHTVYSYSEENTGKVEIEYSDGTKRIIASGGKNYTKMSDDDGTIWYRLNEESCNIEDVMKVYLNDQEVEYYFSRN